MTHVAERHEDMVARAKSGENYDGKIRLDDPDLGQFLVGYLLAKSETHIQIAEPDAVLIFTDPAIGHFIHEYLQLDPMERGAFVAKHGVIAVPMW